jgi:SAM-dependent MidA family methyltransferase
VSALARIIQTEIAAQGAITFARFMELALYQPGLGYYETGRDPVGFRGDFYTSVSTGELFGQLLAFRFARWLEELPAAAAGRRIIEAGAHDGRLARDILAWLRQHRPALLATLQYWILEPSPSRRAWQQEKLREFGGQVQWFDDWPALPDQSAALTNPPARGVYAASTSAHPPSPLGCESAVNRTLKQAEARAPQPERGVYAASTNEYPQTLKLAESSVTSNLKQLESHPPSLSGIIFSNELLDAFPVHRFGWDAARQHWFEWGVGLADGRFIWVKIPPPAGGLQPGVSLPAALLNVLPDGYILETCPAAERWWRTAAGLLDRGRLLTLDYGFTAEEMISPARTRGTLRAYARHQVGDDLLLNPGKQDLTAHVNFSTILAAGESAGLTTEGYLTQPQFLTGILADAVQDDAFRDWTPGRTRQFQTLTHPQHLGRAFKVLIQKRDRENPTNQSPNA